MALAQGRVCKKLLQKHYPQNSYELKIISTKGAPGTEKASRTRLGDKGLFVRGKLEQELLDGNDQPCSTQYEKNTGPAACSGFLCLHMHGNGKDPRDDFEFAGSRFTGGTSQTA